MTDSPETQTTPQTLEQALSVMYELDNYAQIGAKFVGRGGVAGVMVSNESFLPENLRLLPPPDGYIIGAGNGAIWSMLELFPQGILPKGIISLDYDPAVVLSGKVVVELAKRGLSREEAVSYFFGDYMSKPGGTRGDYYKHTVDEVIALAREIAAKEQNPQFRQAMLDAVDKGEFVHDARFMRQRHEMEYKDPLFEVGTGSLEVKGRINTAGIIYKHWDKIVKLAQAGKIFFAHADIGDSKAINFIDTQIPDIKTSRNILYTSNVVDFRYRRDVNALQRLSPDGNSYYVYTTQKPDNYILKATHTPPVYPNFS